MSEESYNVYAPFTAFKEPVFLGFFFNNIIYICTITSRRLFSNNSVIFNLQVQLYYTVITFLSPTFVFYVLGIL